MHSLLVLDLSDTLDSANRTPPPGMHASPELLTRTYTPVVEGKATSETDTVRTSCDIRGSDIRAHLHFLIGPL